MWCVCTTPSLTWMVASHFSPELIDSTHSSHCTTAAAGASDRSRADQSSIRSFHKFVPKCSSRTKQRTRSLEQDPDPDPLWMGSRPGARSCTTLPTEPHLGFATRVRSVAVRSQHVLKPNNWSCQGFKVGKTSTDAHAPGRPYSHPPAGVRQRFRVHHARDT